MEITISQTFKNYKQDSIKYCFNQIFNFYFIGFLFIYLIILLTGFFNYNSNLNFYPVVIDGLIFSLGIGLLGMIIYSAVFLIKAILNINKEKKLLYEGKVHLSFNVDGIMLKTKGSTYKIYWNEIKSLKVISGTAFLVPTKGRHLMVRINQREIISGSFENLTEFIRVQWKAKD